MTTATAAAITNGQVALALFDLDIVPIPCCWPDPSGACGCGNGHTGGDVGKAPLFKGWPAKRPTRAEVQTWWRRNPEANVGINLALSELLAVDADTPEAEKEAYKYGLDGKIIRQSRAPAYLFRRPKGGPGGRAIHWGASGHLDILADGNLIVHGKHRTGADIFLDVLDLSDLDLADAPSWAILALEDAAAKRAPSPSTNHVPADDPPVRLSGPALEAWRGERVKDKSGDVVAREPSSDVDRSGTLFLIGKDLGRGGAARRTIIEALADRDRKLGFDKFTGRPDGGESEYARIADRVLAPDPVIGDVDDDPPAAGSPAPGPTAGPAPRPVDEVLEYLHRGEWGDALLFADLFRDRLVYDDSERAWFKFGPHVWERTSTAGVCGRVADELAAEYVQAAVKTRAKADADELYERAAAIRTLNRVRNVLGFAQGLLKIDSERWDADPDLIACSNGVIDLRTGGCRDGRPGDYIRSSAPTEWQGLDAPAPRWERFIAEILERDSLNGAENAELPDFLRHLLGYGLTGHTSDHVLPVFCGQDGRNGKDTMFETLGAVLGPLAAVVDSEILLARRERSGAADPSLYSLRGKRLCWSSETNKGARLNAGKVKLMTGGGRLTARPLYGNPVEFAPTHLLCLITNHRPHAPSDDAALWERVLVMTFDRRFVDRPQHQNERPRDSRLREKLQSEAPGVLAWLVRGAVEWRRSGLNPPESVRLATEQYRDDEDQIGRFIREECRAGAGREVGAQQLYEAYKSWCEGWAETPASGTVFGRRVGLRYSRKHRETGWYYQGIDLIAPDDGDPANDPADGSLTGPHKPVSDETPCESRASDARPSTADGFDGSSAELSIFATCRPFSDTNPSTRQFGDKGNSKSLDIQGLSAADGFADGSAQTRQHPSACVVCSSPAIALADGRLFCADCVPTDTREPWQLLVEVK